MSTYAVIEAYEKAEAEALKLKEQYGRLQVALMNASNEIREINNRMEDYVYRIFVKNDQAAEEELQFEINRRTALKVLKDHGAPALSRLESQKERHESTVRDLRPQVNMMKERGNYWNRIYETKAAVLETVSPLQMQATVDRLMEAAKHPTVNKESEAILLVKAAKERVGI